MQTDVVCVVSGFHKVPKNANITKGFSGLETLPVVAAPDCPGT